MSRLLTRVTGKHGEFLVLPHDTYVGRSLRTYGQWCESEVTLFAQILRPGMVVAEVGANIGSHTVPIARMVGPSGMVFAVEMQPFVAQVLSANLLLNDLTHVLVVGAGVAAGPGALMVPPIRYDVGYNFGGISVDFLRDKAGGRAQRVPLQPLDELLRLDRLDFLKLDVEGLELAALTGGAGLIETHRPVIYLENDHPEATEALLGFLHARGYAAYWHRSFLFDAGNHAGESENVFGQARCVNLLAVPEGRTVHGLIPAPDAASHPKHHGG